MREKIMRGCLACALVIGFLGASAGLEMRNWRERIRTSVAVWDADLTEAMAFDDWLALRNIGEALHHLGISDLKIDMKNYSVYSSHFEYGNIFCATQCSVNIQRFGQKLGSVEACLSAHDLLLATINPKNLLFAVLGASLVILVAFAPLYRYRRILRRTTQVLSDWAANPKDEFSAPVVTDTALDGIVSLVRRGVEREVEVTSLMIKARSNEQLTLLASQVAHDIRSPLAAFEVVLSEMGELPQEVRGLARSAITRVQDIANLLLDKSRAQKRGAELRVQKLETTLLLSVVDMIAAEVRNTTADRPAPQITITEPELASGLYVTLSRTTLCRIFTILLKNSVEACEAAAKIAVFFQSDDRKIRITVTDNGKGIPASILPRLGKHGATYGKRNGNGIGLSFVREEVERAGGVFELHSEEGKGTSVTFILPRANAPSWHTHELCIEDGTSVAVVDDDAAMHRLWSRRLEFIGGLSARYYRSVQEFLLWHSKNEDTPCTVLVDYDLGESGFNGLHLIAKLGGQQRGILVTGRADEEHVVSEVERLRVKMLSKAFVSTIPIRHV